MKKELIEFLEALKIGVNISLALRHVVISMIISLVSNIFIMFIIWWVIFSTLGINELKGYTLEDLVIYYLIVNFIYLIISSLSNLTWDFYYLVREGTLNNYLTKPWNLIIILLGKGIGYSLIYLLISLTIFVILVIVKGYSLINLFLLLILLLFISFFYISTRLAIAFLSFWLEDLWFVTELYYLIQNALSGLIVPIVFYPQLLQKIIDWLPFKQIYFYPTELITKGTDLFTFIKVILILTIYGIISLLIAKILWDKGIKRYKAYGG